MDGEKLIDKVAKVKIAEAYPEDAHSTFIRINKEHRKALGVSLGDFVLLKVISQYKKYKICWNCGHEPTVGGWGHCDGITICKYCGASLEIPNIQVGETCRNCVYRTHSYDTHHQWCGKYLDAIPNGLKCGSYEKDSEWNKRYFF